MEIVPLLIVLSFILLVIGPSLGSFFSVLAWRDVEKRHKHSTRSACDECGKDLKWFELIPIFSFIFQRGKCRKCGKPINIKFWIAELLGLLLYGLLTLGIWKVSELDIDKLAMLAIFISSFIILTILFYLAVYDLLWMEIPVMVVGYGTIVVIVLNAVFILFRILTNQEFSQVHLGWLDNLLVGIASAFALYLLVKATKEKGLGVGDIWIAMMIGLAIGWPNIISAFYTMIFSATAIGLLFALKERKFKGLKVPLVPFMALGFIVGSFWGTEIFNILFFLL